MIVLIIIILINKGMFLYSSHNSLAIYDIPDQQTRSDHEMCYLSTMKIIIAADDLSTHSDGIKMAECAAYGIHQTQQKPSNDTGVYEQIFTTT